MLKKLFPSCQSSVGKRRRQFDPTEECLVEDLKRKKKSTSTRSKPRSITVVFLPKKTVYVPKGNVRRNLTRQGRTAKVVLKRNMKPKEIKCIVVNAFPSFQLTDFNYMKCSQDNRLRSMADNNLCGDDIFDLAGQGSVYICQVSQCLMIC